MSSSPSTSATILATAAAVGLGTTTLFVGSWILRTIRSKPDESIANQQIIIVQPPPSSPQEPKKRWDVLLIIMSGSFVPASEYESIARALQKQTADYHWDLTVGIAPASTLPLQKPWTLWFVSDGIPFQTSPQLALRARKMAARKVLLEPCIQLSGDAKKTLFVEKQVRTMLLEESELGMVVSSTALQELNIASE